jgi:short-subunit dehydrogenase
VSNYLEGLRQKSRKKNLGIVVSDIRPGFVATPMTENNKSMVWLISADKAARLIATAIERRAAVAYIPCRWAVIAWLLPRLPAWLYDRMM